jgi:hypothetical protein
MNKAFHWRTQNIYDRNLKNRENSDWVHHTQFDLLEYRQNLS